MQKGIYLLQDMGVPVGDYGFRWYRHGPYSQELQDDMYYEDGKKGYTISLSAEHAESVKHLHDIIHSSEREQYTISNWVEALASLHYLHENILRFNASAEDVVAELEKRKPHLNNHNVNLSAYELVEGLFG